MKELKLLEQQLEKLTDKGFDLEAWKQYTVVLLARIFGETNQKVRQVEKIEYDFSSWALRDTTGKSEYLETCKKIGREVLQASIDELKAFGLPERNTEKEKNIPAKVLLEYLEEDLKVSQLKQLLEIVNSGKSIDEKKKAITKFLKTTDKEFPENFLIGLFSNPALINKL